MMRKSSSQNYRIAFSALYLFPRYLLGVRCCLMLQVTAVTEKNKLLPSRRAEIPANKC